MNRFSSTLAKNSRQLHPAYFTGNPFYFDVLLKLNGYIQRIQDFSKGSDLKIGKSQGYWMNAQEFSEKLSIKTSEREYKELIDKLGFLYSHKDLFEASESKEIMDFLEKYLKPESFLKKPVIEYPALDEHHRSMTLGSKKTAKAQVWMIPGEGLVMVNGIHFSDYFDSEMEMQAAVKPFQISRCWGKYNVWAITNGGGKSSKFLKKVKYRSISCYRIGNCKRIIITRFIF